MAGNALRPAAKWRCVREWQGAAETFAVRHAGRAHGHHPRPRRWHGVRQHETPPPAHQQRDHAPCFAVSRGDPTLLPAAWQASSTSAGARCGTPCGQGEEKGTETGAQGGMQRTTQVWVQ